MPKKSTTKPTNPKKNAASPNPPHPPQKKQLKESQLVAEAKAALCVGNATNIMTPVQRFGEYEVGCETEDKYKQFNVKKRIIRGGLNKSEDKGSTTILRRKA